MYPIKFNTVSNDEKTLVHFSPESDIIKQQINFETISLSIDQSTNSFNLYLITHAEGQYDVVNKILTNFVQKNPKEYAKYVYCESWELPVSDNNGNTDQTRKCYAFVFSTQGLEVTKNESLKIIKDFYSSFFAIMDISSNSRKALNDTLKEVLNTDLDLRAPSKGMFPPPTPKKEVKRAKQRVEEEEENEDEDADADVADSVRFAN